MTSPDRDYLYSYESSLVAIVAPKMDARFYIVRDIITRKESTCHFTDLTITPLKPHHLAGLLPQTILDTYPEYYI